MAAKIVLALSSGLVALSLAAAGGAAPSSASPDLQGLTPVTFQSITDLAVDLDNGSVYVLDRMRSAIFRIGPGGIGVKPFAGTTAAGFNGDGKTALATEFRAPAAISLDLRTGEVFVADTYNYRVRAISPRDLTVRTVAGTGLRDVPLQEVPPAYPTYGMLDVGRFGGDGGPALAADLNLPSGVCADPVGILFIADSGNHRVRAVNRGTSPVFLMGVEIGPGAIETIAGTGTMGFGGDGGKASAAQLAFPTQMVVDASGNLLVVDTFNQRLRKIDRQSGIIRTVARGELADDVTPERALTGWAASIISVGVTPTQEIVYSDRVSRTLHRLSRGGEATVLFTAAQPREGRIGSIAAGPRGEVYVADVYHNRVLRLNGGVPLLHAEGAPTDNRPLSFPPARPAPAKSGNGL
jgi:DNA-binding beta-propeller fold protein YncE